MAELDSAQKNQTIVHMQSHEFTSFLKHSFLEIAKKRVSSVVDRSHAAIRSGKFVHERLARRLAARHQKAIHLCGRWNFLHVKYQTCY
jgi:hypothetical protein